MININKIDHYDKIKEIIQDYKCINKCQARWFLELRMELKKVTFELQIFRERLRCMLCRVSERIPEESSRFSSE